MKERIYTIPLTEALDSDCECLLCRIEKETDEKTVLYFTGPAMMEPDTRTEINRKGFCRRHYDKMLEADNKLSLALTLQTRLAEVRQRLEGLSNNKKEFLQVHQAPDPGSRAVRFSEKSKITRTARNLLCYKKRLRKGSLSEEYKELFSTCAACEKVAQRMNDCIDNFVYLLCKEPDFREKFLSSKGLCMKHFNAVVPLLPAGLAEKVTALQINEIKRINGEIDKFCMKFDYRSADLDIESVKNSPSRAAEKISSAVKLF